MSAITPYEWAIIAFVIGVTFLCVFMLTVPLLLGGKSWGRAKQEQFESGVVSAGGARIRLSAKFYLVAIFFVVFDLEALYLYAWASSVREVGWIGFATAAIFILVLLVGLVYELSTGALNWHLQTDVRQQELKLRLVRQIWILQKLRASTLLKNWLWIQLVKSQLNHLVL